MGQYIPNKNESEWNDLQRKYNNMTDFEVYKYMDKLSAAVLEGAIEEDNLEYQFVSWYVQFRQMPPR